MAVRPPKHGIPNHGDTPYEKPRDDKRKGKDKKRKLDPDTDKARQQTKQPRHANDDDTPGAPDPMDSGGTATGGAGGGGDDQGPGPSGSGGVGGGHVPPPTYDPSGTQGDQRNYGIVMGGLGETMNYKSVTGSQRAYLNSKLSLKRALTGLSATYMDDRTRTLFPKYEASMKPTRTDKPFDGDILELLRTIGLKDGNRCTVDLEYGFAKLTTKPKPGVIEFTSSIADSARFVRQDFDVNMLKEVAGKKALLPGAGGIDVVCSNLQYCWTPLVVSYSAYESRRTLRRRFGKVGGKPKRGHYLLTQEWLNQQGRAMFGKQPEGDVTVLDLGTYLETAFASVIAHGGHCEFALMSHGAPKFFSDTMRLKLTRKVIAATKKIKKKDGKVYNEMINNPTVRAYYLGRNSTGVFPRDIGVIKE